MHRPTRQVKNSFPARTGGRQVAVKLMIKGVLAGRTPVPWRFLPSSRTIIVALLVIATLLMGTEGTKKIRE